MQPDAELENEARENTEQAAGGVAEDAQQRNGAAGDVPQGDEMGGETQQTGEPQVEHTDEGEEQPAPIPELPIAWAKDEVNSVL